MTYRTFEEALIGPEISSSSTWNDENGIQHLVRLIDTPEMVDVRGSDSDKIIANIACEIHGIIILLQPNQTKFSVNLRYCLNELFSRLHRDALKNIFFVFPCARASNFKPRDTVDILRGFLREINNKQGVSSNERKHVFLG